MRQPVLIKEDGWLCYEMSAHAMLELTFSSSRTTGPRPSTSNETAPSPFTPSLDYTTPSVSPCTADLSHTTLPPRTPLSDVREPSCTASTSTKGGI